MKTIYPILIVVLICAKCSPKMSVDWTKEEYSDRSFKKIAVVGIGKDLSARLRFEEEAVELFRKNGINAYEGIDFFHDNMTKDEQNVQNFIRIVTENNLDGIITMSLVDTKETMRYNEGEDFWVPVGYYSHFGKYYAHRYTRVHSAGYYSPSKEYLIEAVLYDLKGELYEGKETLVWKGQSNQSDPSSLNSIAKKFTKKMVAHMIKDEIIMAPKAQLK